MTEQKKEKGPLWQARLDEESYTDAESLLEQAIAEGKADNKKDFQLKLIQMWKLQRLKEGKGLPKIDPVIVGKYSGDISRLASLTGQIDKLFISLLEHFTSEQTTVDQQYEASIARLNQDLDLLKVELDKAYIERNKALEEKKELEIVSEKAISEKKNMEQHLFDIENSIRLERKTHEQETLSLSKDLKHEKERIQQKDQQFASIYNELQESKELVHRNQELIDQLKQKEEEIISLNKDHTYQIREQLLSKESELRQEFNKELSDERKNIRKEAKEEAWEVCAAKIDNLKATHKSEMSNLKKQYENEIRLLKDQINKDK